MRLTFMKGFWDTEIISGTTINYLPTPSVGPLSLNFLLYIFIIIITAYILIKKRDHSGKSVKKALLIAFGAAFFLFTLRMDLNWIALMKADSENLFNKPIKERFQYLDGNNFYEFIEFVRASIPENESIRDEFHFTSEAAKQMHEMGTYYLLPTLTSSKGRYIWIYHRAGASYDAKSGILRLNNNTSYRVSPHALHKTNEAVFKITGEL
jgi:hypothetical protein